MTKDFLEGFVKFVEMPFYCSVFLWLVNASILNAECKVNKTLLLLVNAGREVRAVPLCSAVVKLRV